VFVKPFAYAAAGSVAEAASILRAHGPEARILAGGQSLLPIVNLGLAQPRVLVDLGRASGLDGLERANDTLVVGAMVRHRTLETSAEVASSWPLLAAAIRHVGSPRVRVRGTLGGSLAHADPAAELPLAMLVLEATYDASDGEHVRNLGAEGFAVSYFTTTLAEGEVLTAARVPALEEGVGWGFHELSRRAGDFALVAAAALASCRDGVVDWIRLGLGGVGERPVRCPVFEKASAGASIDGLEALGDTIVQGLAPPDDTAAGGDYRLRVARVLGLRAAIDACRRSIGARS